MTTSHTVHTTHPLSARGAGVLLHPTSLPGRYGIGDLGPAAYAWVDALAAAGQSWWQILPLGPTGYGDSPYQCFSAFAGNPNLISPELLVEDGLVAADDLLALEVPIRAVDYQLTSRTRNRLLERAWSNFQEDAHEPLAADWQRFQAEQAGWLGDFSLFMTLKQAHGGGSWVRWPDQIRHRDPAAVSATSTHGGSIAAAHAFTQFLFSRQWHQLKAYANAKGIRIIGDMPIFIAEDSADVWANPELFQLDADRRPRVVAGVPPDYFSSTGQLWGNPLYDWDAHERTGFAWWVARLKHALTQVDLVRLDHFRGFEAYWEVPAGSPTAETGRWVKGPGAKLLTTLRDALGDLPIIAEDLGVITPEVDALRQSFGLPGMRILQFAFGGAVEGRFLPHNYENPTVVYTGTHDNDTSRGWFAALKPAERSFTLRYLNANDVNVVWEMIRAAWASVAVLAVAPAQDLLGLGSEARMNVPGRPSGNWRWRLPESGLTPEAVGRLRDLTELYQRGPGSGPRGHQGRDGP